jgi:hypothetical protein
VVHYDQAQRLCFHHPSCFLEILGRAYNTRVFKKTFATPLVILLKIKNEANLGVLAGAKRMSNLVWGEYDYMLFWNFYFLVKLLY